MLMPGVLFLIEKAIQHASNGDATGLVSPLVQFAVRPLSL
jgi:hypothetical protein